MKLLFQHYFKIILFYMYNLTVSHQSSSNILLFIYLFISFVHITV